MAKPTTIRFGRMLIKIATPATPTVFVAPCGFTTKSLALTKNLEEVNIPDCDNPDDPAWVGRDVSSLTASVSGEGVLAEESLQMWQAFFASTESYPVEIELLLAAAGSTFVWSGQMHLANFTVNGEQGGRLSVSVELQSDGEMTGVFTPPTTP